MSYPERPYVELKNFKPEAESIQLLQALEAAGLSDPILCGSRMYGAYANQVRGMSVPMNDYDISCGIDLTEIKAALNNPDEKMNREDLLAAAFRKYLQKILPGFKIKPDPNSTGKQKPMAHLYISENGELLSAQATLSYMGKELQMIFYDKEAARGGFERSLYGEVSLLRIAMNSSGQVVAAPEFERDMDNSIIRPYEHIEPDQIKYDRTIQKLLKKFPGFQFVNADPTAEQIAKQQARQNASEATPTPRNDASILGRCFAGFKRVLGR